VPAAQTHAVTRLLPAGDVLPAAQSRHTVDEEAPTVVEYLPAPQSVQTEAPAVAEYLPAGQPSHSPLELQVYMIFLQFPSG